MAKKKTTAASNDAATAEIIKTIAGDEIAISELAHIAPHLQPFAVAVASLTLDPNNAREHDKKSIASKAATLRDFGQQELIQFDPETRIVKVGNGRLAAATRVLEWKWIAAVGSTLPAAKLRAFALAHNRTGETSGWNMEALQRELDALRDEQDDGELEEVQLDEMGFGEDDLEDLQADAQRKTASKQTAVDAKKSESVEGTTFQVVLSCNNERHQTDILRSIEEKDIKSLLKHLTGVDVRARAV